MDPNTNPSADGAETFEEALRRLERVVEELERGEPGLTEALACYEQGVRLLVRCQAELDRAERSVALLSGVDEAGNPVTTPFDATATVDASPAPTPPPAAKPRKRPAAPADGDEPFIPF